MTKGQFRNYFQADVVEMIEGFPVTLTEDDFEDYQWYMTDLMQTHRHVLLGAFMGSGKTACALHAARCLLDKGKIKKILVVAPLNVAKDTWPDEIMVWDFARDFTYSVIVGDAERREAAARAEADIYFVNRENLRWLCQFFGYRNWPFDCLIYDEASRLKGASKETKPTTRKDGSVSRPRLSEFGYLARFRPHFKYVWELSGTPCPNGLIDLWGPIYVLDLGKRLGHNISAFRSRWFSFDSYKYTYKPHPHSEREIMERLKDVMFVLKEEDYLDLPPLVVRDRWVNLSPRHQNLYNQFEEEAFLAHGYDVEAANKGVLCNKLLQFANGSIYAEEDPDDLDSPTVAKHIHDRKLDELGSVFEEAAGASVLIAYSFKFDVLAIKKRYPFVQIYGQDGNDIRNWNRGRYRAMILHPASAGHGLNFQRGGNIACWYGLNWSLELYQQFNKRLARRGQEADHVWLYRILARKTHDARVVRALDDKDVTQERITDTVRVRPQDIGRAA